MRGCSKKSEIIIDRAANYCTFKGKIQLGYGLVTNQWPSARKDLGLGIVDLEYETDIENQKIVHVGFVDFKKCICKRMISLLE